MIIGITVLEESQSVNDGWISIISWKIWDNAHGEVRLIAIQIMTGITNLATAAGLRPKNKLTTGGTYAA